jgi:hypothetical protein
MAKKPEEMLDSMLENLNDKTGKSLDEWIAIVQGAGVEKHREIINFLKSEHDFTYGYANLVATRVREAGSGGPKTEGNLVDAQYSGPKGGLRPIYDAIINSVQKYGGDMEISPKKTYVSLRRSKQFAIIQASTKTRVDVGINLKGVKPTERLEPSGSFNAMVSHRVRLSDAEDVNDELIKWLKDAYEAA